MPRLRALQSVLLAVLAACVWTGCDNSDKTPLAAYLVAHCQQLAKACGDADQHVETIAAECAQAGEKQLAHGCAAEALAAYDCFEKNLCGKGDQVWALDDLRVLSERHGECTAQREALRACAEPEQTSND